MTHTHSVLRTEGNLFKDNDNTNTHISADDHPEKTSRIKGATTTINADNLNEHAREGDRLDSPEGPRINSTGHDYTGVLIGDCDSVYQSSPSSLGIIIVPTYGNHGSSTMCNCRITNSIGVQTTYTEPVDIDIAWGPWDVNLENVTIPGACESQPYGSMVIVDENRNGSHIVDNCIYLPNGRVDGVLVNRASGYAIEHFNISVSDSPMRTRGVEPAPDDMTYTATRVFRGE